MLSVTSDLFGGFYRSSALFIAPLGFICPGENLSSLCVTTLSAEVLEVRAHTYCTTIHITKHQDEMTTPSSPTKMSNVPLEIVTLFFKFEYMISLSRYC